MRALQLLDWKRDAEIVEVPRPVAGPGQVLVRIGGAGACHSDLHLMHDFESGRLPWTLPFTLGHENAGWVEAVGAGVTSVAEGDAAWRGFAIFRDQCVHCHAVNRQGGRVGPELNVPRSIVEYRPVEQIKAYIQNPLAFRYSTMPAHPGFGDAELDGLVAYFSAMKDRKQDDEKSTKSP